MSKIFGTYLGFVEFDGKRYWDIRDAELYPLIKPATILPSDGRCRPDLLFLQESKLDEAQKSKEDLEELQRKDVKTREEWEKKHR